MFLNWALTFKLHHFTSCFTFLSVLTSAISPKMDSHLESHLHLHFMAFSIFCLDYVLLQDLKETRKYGEYPKWRDSYSITRLQSDSPLGLLSFQGKHNLGILSLISCLFWLTRKSRLFPLVSARVLWVGGRLSLLPHGSEHVGVHTSMPPPYIP